MLSVAPPKRRFCRFLYYPRFLRSTPPPTLERAVGQKRTATQSVVSTDLIKKLNEKRKKKTRQNIVLCTWFCQITARQRYLRTPQAAISYVWFRQFFRQQLSHGYCRVSLLQSEGPKQRKEEPFSHQNG